MDAPWRTLELFVPSSLTHREAMEYLYAQLRSIAHEAGDFIEEVRLGAGVHYSAEWHRFRASYLPGATGDIR